MKIKPLWKPIALLAAATAGLALVSCKEEGPAEKAGKEIDKAAEEAGDKLEEAADKLKGEPETLGDKIKDKAEELGDKVEEATDN